MRPALGTFVEIAAVADDQAVAGAALDAAFAQIALAQARWSWQAADSELTRLNAARGRWVAVSRETVRLLRRARWLMRLSGAAFDVTLGGALMARGVLPDIELRAQAARLRRPVLLTLDGIAKGLAVDLAIEALRAHGCAAGWVNAGGDMRAFGTIELPLWRREADGRLLALGGLRDAAVATSQVMDEAVADEAQRARFPACILPATQQPAAVGVWSVLARSAWRADALTKVAANAAPADRAARVARLGGRLLVSAGDAQVIDREASEVAAGWVAA